MNKKYTIAVAGTGYVGLSVATLLSQHHKVYAVDIVSEKVNMVNQRRSPIQDDYIEKYVGRPFKTIILKNIWQRRTWI